MKTEQIGLRTWFLVAVATWAGATWLATGFGLGAQLPAASEDAPAAATLPELPAVAAERMAGADSYAPISARPLFAEDRRPRPYLLGGGEASTSSSLRLTGVLLADSFAMATLTTEQNRSVRLRLNGEAVDGWQLVELQPRQATVIGPGGSQTLQLAVFDGQGGEPPTRLGGQTGAPPPAAAPQPPPAAATLAGNRGNRTPAAAPAPVPAQAPAKTGNDASNGPSEEQMRAIRERIQARRQQLQQQQQQQSPPPGNGGGANR